MSAELEKLRIEHREEDYSAPPPTRIWKILFFALLVISSGVIVFLLRTRLSTDVVEVRVERVRTAGSGPAAAGGFSAAGWVKLPQYHPVFVTPLTEGRLEEILVVEGDPVKKGAVIGRLYREDYKAAHDAAGAALNAARAHHEKLKSGYRKQEVREARAEVDRLAAEVMVAKDILEHSKELHPSGAIPLEELQKDEARFKITRAGLQKARERLALLEEGYRREDIALAAATVEQARAELALAGQKLGYTEILSPMDGVVLDRLASCGQWITPGKGMVVSLFDPADLDARIDVNQDDIARVFPGQQVEITTRAEPDILHKGNVIVVEPRADLVKNTIPVRVKLLMPEGSLIHPDMVVKARFLAKQARAGAEPAGGTERAAITVPEVSVLNEGENHHVFVILEGSARQLKVTPGSLENGRIEILNGLRGGEQVVMSGMDRLTDGAPVRIIQ